MPTVAILGRSQQTLDAVADHLKSSNVNFIFSYRNVQVHRYLNVRGYRKCTVYAVKDCIFSNSGNYVIKSFTSDIEVEEALKQDSQVIVL